MFFVYMDFLDHEFFRGFPDKGQDSGKFVSLFRKNADVGRFSAGRHGAVRHVNVSGGDDKGLFFVEHGGSSFRFSFMVLVFSGVVNVLYNKLPIGKPMGP